MKHILYRDSANLPIAQRLRWHLLQNFLCALLGLSPGAFGETKAPVAELKCRNAVEMGTPFSICVVVKQEQSLHFEMDVARAFRKIREINDWMSEWQPGTELSKVNEAAGARAVKVRSDLIRVLEATLAIASKTDGALDPTFNALWGLYSFKAGSTRAATDAELAERLPLIAFRDVVIDAAEQTVFLKRSGMKLGLGAVGQGFAVDRVVELLKDKGYSGGYVDGSGDTRFWGLKPDGSQWITAVRDPRDKDKVALRIYGTDFAVTTCGDDEKVFVQNGERIHHVIDPKTGKPSRASRQVTVIAPTAFAADAWDTAAFVLGPKKASELLRAEGLNAVHFGPTGDLQITSGLKKVSSKWGEAYQLK